MSIGNRTDLLFRPLKVDLSTLFHALSTKVKRSDADLYGLILDPFKRIAVFKCKSYFSGYQSVVRKQIGVPDPQVLSFLAA